ncbi:NAD(P)-dependent oxidoreductase [Hymenobacter fodinae]|uniref:NAD(P)-dependent oxidoreductase n=2 Tax=Hymenobacter fodinae TaxID=2510796 RepID=A0A4Z0P0B7_9BACT|nr:NAD(P)-dependent oxidoreductase [Hymenobacter fodinae]
MKIVVTGSSGRVGRAIYNQLASQHEVVGIDRAPFATTRIVADFVDADVLRRAVQGAGMAAKVWAQIHVASPPSCPGTNA